MCFLFAAWQLPCCICQSYIYKSYFCEIIHTTEVVTISSKKFLEKFHQQPWPTKKYLKCLNWQPRNRWNLLAWTISGVFQSTPVPRFLWSEFVWGDPWVVKKGLGNMPFINNYNDTSDMMTHHHSESKWLNTSAWATINNSPESVQIKKKSSDRNINDQKILTLNPPKKKKKHHPSQ